MNNIISFDCGSAKGCFRPLNAVNNGPLHNRRTDDMLYDNLEAYVAAKIPYARNHDASFCSDYGGEHTVDVAFIFPDFDADADDPASYDFACTDEYVAVTQEAGTETFYRLGHHIEHGVKKYGTLPPKDFRKWAVICEHIIMHFNEGWADGFHYNLQYWEIWNEPSGDPDDSKNKRCWGGTEAQFHDFFEVASKYLKERFPHLSIGGPSINNNLEWAMRFIPEMRRRHVPMDFFSWHIYCQTPETMMERAERLRGLLDENGYEKTLSICNEWNYIRSWSKDFMYSIQTIISLKGAAFAMSCICSAHYSTIDMLMYYDARPSSFNGMFDFYTLRRLKGYYPIMWYGGFYDGYKPAQLISACPNIYAVCGVKEDGKRRLMAVYYDNKDDAENRQVTFSLGAPGSFRVYLLDNEHDSDYMGIVSDLTFDFKNYSAILLEEE